MVKIPRLPWDEYFMLQAHLVATRSTCNRGPELLLSEGRHGVGAVIVRDHRVIASGYNGSPPGEPHCDNFECLQCGTKFTEDRMEKHGYVCSVCGDGGKIAGGHLMVDGHCVRTIHAELNAITQCALDGVSTKGATLYCTASPCYDCSKVIVRAQIRRVVIGNDYSSRYGLSDDAKVMLLGDIGGVDYVNLDINKLM